MGVCYRAWYRASIAAVCLIMASPSARPDTPLYTHRTSQGVMVFSDTPLENGSLARRSYGSTTRRAMPANPCKGLSTSQLNARGQTLDSDFAQVAALYSLDAMLLKSVARAESCFDPRAVSRAGAQGLMQLMPGTASELGVTDPYDLQQSLRGGARYLAQMLERYSADTHLALAAYNAGPGNVDRYQGVPPFAETQQYIRTVLRFQQQYSQLASRQ